MIPSNKTTIWRWRGVTYLEKAQELKEEIRHGISHSDEICLGVVEEWNRIIGLIMYGGPIGWHDEYEEPTI